MYLLKDYLTITEKNLIICYKNTDAIYVRHTLDSLLKAYSGLKAYFGTNLQIAVRAILVPSRSEYDRLVVNLLGVDIEIPSNPGRVAQPQKTDILFLSPSAYKNHSLYRYDPAEFSLLVFHELTHVFEEYLSPDIEKTPRWWSEGLAVYLSGHWCYEDQFNFRQSVTDNLSRGCLPRIKDIFSSVELSYEWGWTLVMFIESILGKEAIINTVKGCKDGDILQYLNADPQNFELRYKEWILSSGKKLIFSPYIRIE